MLTGLSHHLRISQSERIVWLAEELGIDYDLKLYDRDPERGSPRPRAEGRSISMQIAPLITDGDLVLGRKRSDRGIYRFRQICALGTPPGAPAPESNPDFADHL